MKNIRAIIPVAGIGTRLRPHTYTLPKVLLNVAGKPILGHILDRIQLEGISKVTFIVGYLGEKVIDYVENNYNFDAEYIEQEEQYGLGHAIYLARETFMNDELLIVLGDTVFDVDLKSMLSSKYSALGVKEVEDPRRFGVAIVENEFITKLVEKPETPISNLAIVGLYYIKDSKLLSVCLDEIIKNNIRTKDEYQLTDALQLMLDKGEKFIPFLVEGWFDCGKPETLLSTNHHLLEKMNNNEKIEGVTIIKPVYISPNSKVQNSIIGPYTTINDGAIVKNSIVVNSIIGINSIVENEILRDSIIGNNTIIKGQFRKLNTGDSTEIIFD
ncbi:MAG: sugar phosphate nucleotidyltransferase [Ignavibacteria bacterium]